jgi:hypothetical protein
MWAWTTRPPSRSPAGNSPKSSTHSWSSPTRCGKSPKTTYRKCPRFKRSSNASPRRLHPPHPRSHTPRPREPHTPRQRHRRTRHTQPPPRTPIRRRPPPQILPTMIMPIDTVTLMHTEPGHTISHHPAAQDQQSSSSRSAQRESSSDPTSAADSHQSRTTPESRHRTASQAAHHNQGTAAPPAPQSQPTALQIPQRRPHLITDDLTHILTRHALIRHTQAKAPAQQLRHRHTRRPHIRSQVIRQINAGLTAHTVSIPQNLP